MTFAAADRGASALYDSIEAFANALGPIEIVARERYVLLRSVRIFADLVIMADAVRIAIHLQRKVEGARFFKVVRDAKKVTHVTKLQTEKGLQRHQAVGERSLRGLTCRALVAAEGELP